MSLPWVRLDTNLAMHDKILSLLSERPEALAFRAAFSYVCAIGYAGAHGTDGVVPFSALPFIHGTKKTADLLVRHHLWRPDRLGWCIANYEKRQQLTAATKAIRNAQRMGAKRGNCARWHGDGCQCWQQEEAS